MELFQPRGVLGPLAELMSSADLNTTSRSSLYSSGFVLYAKLDAISRIFLSVSCGCCLLASAETNANPHLSIVSLLTFGASAAL